jgi:hypothetical protein
MSLDLSTVRFSLPLPSSTYTSLLFEDPQQKLRGRCIDMAECALYVELKANSLNSSGVSIAHIGPDYSAKIFETLVLGPRRVKLCVQLVRVKTGPKKSAQSVASEGSR